jgi:ATP-dependent Clp protease ATP-binding subunit ClpC
MAAIFGRFSRRSQAILEESQRLAEKLGRPVASDTILLAILTQPGTPAAELLKQSGLEFEHLFEQLVPSETTGESETSPEVALLLEEALKLAARFRATEVEVEHVLAIIARNTALTGHKALVQANVDPARLLNRLTEWLFSLSVFSGQTDSATRERQEQGQEQRSELEKYTIDLTELAATRELDPVIGREKELDQLIAILLRRRKNNPLLLGDPGVGKTALVDGLAMRIAKQEVPRALIGKRVLLLDLSLVVAGTMYRGQFEERLKAIVQEIQDDGETILFIDEVHTLSGTGSAEGGFDAATILKPALARGELSLIGATTFDDYRTHVMKDKALDRRFQVLEVREPQPKDALRMLKGIRKELERHHAVKITDAALQAATDLSTRYIHDRFLPDKAIDILDEASTQHAPLFVKDQPLSRIQEELILVSEQKIAAIERAESDDEYALAKALAEQETQLLKEIRRLKKEQERTAILPEVTAAHVAGVVSQRTGIPLRDIEQSLQPVDFGKVQAILRENILGQHAATDAISQALLRGQLGLNPEHKPMGAFLLVGPTGTGKTETARVLAREVFGDQNALIKVDMSEYMERHSVSNLIGAPAGYVGFEQGGSLTEKVRRQPYAVVLFDEVEKAHPDVFNLLLQLLEDGYLTDNRGAKISFAHTLVLMTSNIGMQEFAKAARIGFERGSTDDTAGELRHAIDKELKSFFRPELLGRLSGVLYYQPLTREAIRALFTRRFAMLKQQLKKRKLNLQIPAPVLSWAVGKYVPESGARSIESLFLTSIEPAIIEAHAAHPAATTLALSIQDTHLHVRPA